MESYKIEHLTFTYPNQAVPAVSDVTVAVSRGEFVTLCGKSGCGKSTLLRQLKPVIAPHGERSGNVLFMGKPVESMDMREQSSKIGFVMQSPDNQIVTDKVWHELAFGPESLGLSTSEIRSRVSEIASFFGIQTWFHKKITELSGGQKQLLNLASVMVMQPQVLILDEPTSQLDPISAQDFFGALSKINRELGTTVILTEQRLEEAFAASDRVLVMDSGSVIADGTPKEVGETLSRANHDMRDALPAPMRIYAGVENNLERPVTVREGRKWIEAMAKETEIKRMDYETADCNYAETPVIEMKDIWFRYGKDLPDVLKGLSAKIYQSELYAVVGGNGTGKTTALSIISGLLTPYRGEVLINGVKSDKIKDKYNGLLGVLPQNPQALFVKQTVKLDLYEMLSPSKLGGSEKDDRVKKVVRLCELEELLDRHPYDLSGGEQQRAALAKILLLNPRILLLDEPTKGMDAHFKKTFAGILSKLKASGVTIIMVSHDIEFCAQYADRCAMFFDGAIVSEDRPRGFFSGRSFYTTSANRMARGVLPEAILAEDVILALGGEIPEDGDTASKSEELFLESTKSTPNEKPDTPARARKGKLSKRTIASMFVSLLAIPLTIFAGAYYLQDRKYYFISLLIIFEAFIPFCIGFEGRKPQARELAVVSVLCAVAVAGRAAFIMLPQFKPAAAIIIIAGAGLGAETGFLVGAVTAFASNFFFGQGPWTPWQMIAFALIGFLAGILFGKGFLKRTKASLVIFGGLATLIIYGGIMNPASVLMWQNKPNMAMIVSSYIMGLPFDLTHAASTVLFLWFISAPMLRKLDRIKTKYGMTE